MNDLLAQQQALLNQVMQAQQHFTWAYLALTVAGLLVTAFVIYMFYARLRDIADALKNFRIAYEFAHPPERSGASRRSREALGTANRNPYQELASDAKYMPR